MFITLYWLLFSNLCNFYKDTYIKKIILCVENLAQSENVIIGKIGFMFVLKRRRITFSNMSKKCLKTSLFSITCSVIHYNLVVNYICCKSLTQLRDYIHRQDIGYSTLYDLYYSCLF